MMMIIIDFIDEKVLNLPQRFIVNFKGEYLDVL